jgi:hypothetical protein
MIFKTIDEKLKAIGFNKVDEDNYIVQYERKNEKYNYIQCLDLMSKNTGKHLISSYQKDINKDGFNNSVGLTMYESKLAIKKMRQWIRKYKKDG